jgi:phosphonate transport system permease protein
LTGSGIGFLFDLYYKSQQYRSASLIVLTLVVIVIAIESLSNLIRRKIL